MMLILEPSHNYCNKFWKQWRTIRELNGNLVGVAYAALDKDAWVKAGILKSLPTDMGYAIQSKMINKVIEYNQNEEFTKVITAERIYKKMLPSVVFVAY